MIIQEVFLMKLTGKAGDARVAPQQATKSAQKHYFASIP